MADPMQDSIAALTRYFVGDATMGETLDRVCRSALEAVEPAKYCGISMTVEGRIGTYIFSDLDVPEIDRAQYETGHGPCVDCFRSGESVLVSSTAEPNPYPEFSEIALRHGVRSVLSSPMRTSDETVGALNLYADRANVFGPERIRVAQAFAAQAAFLLVNTKAYWDARTLSEDLTEAMQSRAEIEQAKGIIMTTMGVGADEAFDILKQQSQHENVKLRDLAAEITHRAARNRQ
jgi:GAF domain-containing protein